MRNKKSILNIIFDYSFNFFLIPLLLIMISLVIPSCDGFNWYHSINIDSCHQKDIAILNSFIDNSNKTINQDLDVNYNGSIDPLELGWQLWEDGRLIHLICSDVPSPYYIDNLYCNLSGQIPNNIGDLDMLIKLHIDSNLLDGSIPESICKMPDILFDRYWLRLSDNKLCPPYPECINKIVGSQVLDECHK